MKRESNRTGLVTELIESISTLNLAYAIQSVFNVRSGKGFGDG